MADLSFFQKPIATLTHADVERLVKDRTPESHILDYKQTNYTDSGELAKDICAFANTNGGYLILGVAEEIKNKKPTGIPREIIGIEDDPNLVKRLCDMIINSVSSRPLVNFKPIQIPDSKKVVLVIYAPRSFEILHMVMVKGKHQFRYYKRYHDQNVPMDEYEVRTRYDMIGRGAKYTKEMLVEKAAETYKRISGTNPRALIIAASPILHLGKFEDVDIARSFDDFNLHERFSSLFTKNRGTNQTDIRMNCYERTDDRDNPCVIVRYYVDGLIAYATTHVFSPANSGKVISAGNLAYQIYHLLNIIAEYFSKYQFLGYLSLYTRIVGLKDSHLSFPNCQRTSWYSFNGGQNFAFPNDYPDFWTTVDINALFSGITRRKIADECCLPLFREVGLNETQNLWDKNGEPTYNKHY